MKTIKITLILICVSLASFAQVGIGNTDPKATLDITASNTAAPLNTDGILIPKIDDFPGLNPGTDQNGMMVFVTGNGIPTKGFYYWDNGNWVNITKNYTVSNGLTEISNDIQLGGTLAQNTTIDFGSFNDLNYNLSSSSSNFYVQESGSNIFRINGSNGETTFGQDTYWRDGTTAATVLGRFYDIGSYGVLDIYSGGTVNTSLRALGTSYFNNSNLAVGTATPSNYRLNVESSGGNTFYVANFQQESTASSADGIAIRMAGAPSTGGYYIGMYRITAVESGKINGLGAGVQYATTSDRRLKTNIENISNALELLNQIQPQIYEFKEFPGVKEYGFIAQDLQKIYPQAVAGSPDSDPAKNPMMVDYGRLTPILTAGVKELRKEMIKLKEENEVLKEKLNKLEQLEARLNALEKKINYRINQ